MLYYCNFFQTENVGTKTVSNHFTKFDLLYQNSPTMDGANPRINLSLAHSALKSGMYY